MSTTRIFVRAFGCLAVGGLFCWFATVGLLPSVSAFIGGVLLMAAVYFTIAGVVLLGKNHEHD